MKSVIVKKNTTQTQTYTCVETKLSTLLANSLNASVCNII